jgi:hypothetical protein
MYLKTISPDVPRFTFVCSIYVLTLFVILVLVTVAILDGIWTTTEKNEMRTRSLIYPAMTAFTDQYSLPNIFLDIGQL